MEGRYDIAIIGGGPGGYVAAIRVAQLGAKVALVEKDRLGGVCLNRGCIPTKALVKSIELLNQLKEAHKLGVIAGEAAFDFASMMAHKKEVVEKLVAGVGALMRANKIEVLRGTGQFLKPGLVRVSGEEGSAQDIAADKIIIATGSVSARPPIPGLDLPGVLTSDDVLELEEVPTDMVIVGGGVIGIEFATIFNALGTKVTIIEMLPRILLPVDHELARRYGQLLKGRGVEVHLNSPVKEIKPKDGRLLVRFEAPKGEVTHPLAAVKENSLHPQTSERMRQGEVEAEKALVATGRTPYTAALNLEELGVKVERRAIVVDECLRTSVPDIYAIGDVTGGIMLAHVASYEGEVAAENALGHARQMDYSVVPNCVFSMPEIAGVGFTEEEAKEKGLVYKVSRFPFRASGRALTMGETEGLVKMICEGGTGQVLGLHIIGPHATDLIAEGALAIRLGATARDIAETIHAHPTLPEAVMEAALGQLGGSIHIAPPLKHGKGRKRSPYF